LLLFPSIIPSAHLKHTRWLVMRLRKTALNNDACRATKTAYANSGSWRPQCSLLLHFLANFPGDLLLGFFAGPPKRVPQNRSFSMSKRMIEQGKFDHGCHLPRH
jgi:hypothetical protein